MPAKPKEAPQQRNTSIHTEAVHDQEVLFEGLLSSSLTSSKGSWFYLGERRQASR